MNEQKADQLKADLKQLAAKYNLQDILIIYSYPDPSDNETFSIGTATMIDKDSVFYKHLNAVKRHLVTGKFWETLG